MEEKKQITKPVNNSKIKIQTKPEKQFINNDDISWMKSSQQADINKLSDDELYATKSAHSSRRFKQNMIYAARRTNLNSVKNQFKEELEYHSSRCGWWEDDYDGPITENIDKKYNFTR